MHRDKNGLDVNTGTQNKKPLMSQAGAVICTVIINNSATFTHYYFKAISFIIKLVWHYPTHRVDIVNVFGTGQSPSK